MPVIIKKNNEYLLSLKKESISSFLKALLQSILILSMLISMLLFLNDNNYSFYIFIFFFLIFILLIIVIITNTGMLVRSAFLDTKIKKLYLFSEFDFFSIFIKTEEMDFSQIDALNYVKKKAIG
ncbi:MAG: hypothetical protein ACK4YF_09095 [Exilispira sp.]